MPRIASRVKTLCSCEVKGVQRADSDLISYVVFVMEVDQGEILGFEV